MTARGNPDRAAAGIIDTSARALPTRIAWAREWTRLALILELDEHVVTVRERDRGNAERIAQAPGHGRWVVVFVARQPDAAWCASAYWDGVRLSERIGPLAEREWALIEHALVRADAARRDDDANG